MGIASEYLAREYLRRRHPQEMSDRCWISSNRAAFCPDGEGDDSLGYDFRIVTARNEWLYEVKSALDEVLGDAKPHLMVTDPPYGVSYDPAWRNEAGRALDGTIQRLSSGKASVPLGARALGKVENDDRADWSEAWAWLKR
jgi:hypothetical protein